MKPVGKTNTPLKTRDDIEIRTSKYKFSENTTICIREHKSCNLISNHELTIMRSTEATLNSHRTTKSMSDKITVNSEKAPSSKLGKVPGYRTPQDVAKMPACVLNQLSHDKRFALLKRRSVSEDKSCTMFEREIKEKVTQRTARNCCTDQAELKVDSLFNAEYNFPIKNDQRNNLGRSLIDSIRNTVQKFVKKDDVQVYTDNSDWDTHSDLDVDKIPSFPKETRNATIIPLAKIQSKKATGPCKFCRQNNKKLHENFYLCFGEKISPRSDAKDKITKKGTTEVDNVITGKSSSHTHIDNEPHKTESTAFLQDTSCKSVDVNQSKSLSVEDEDNINYQADQKGLGLFKNFDKIPCPRNLLCEQGLHSGRCLKEVRRKLSAPICQDDECACRKTDSLNDLSTVMWPGRVIRTPILIKSSLESLTTTLTEDYSIHEHSKITREKLNKCDKNCEDSDDLTTVASEEGFSVQENAAVEEGEDDFNDNQSTSSSTTTTLQHPCHHHHYCQNYPYNTTMNGVNGHHHHHHHHHSNGDMNGGGICGGDIITQNQQKGCWTIGLINSKFRYLTAETFGFKINANGASLKKKQIWTLEPVNSNSSDSLIYLRSHLDKYLAVDSFGNVTCESDEKDPGSKFQISVADDGSGRWALKNVVRGYFLGSSADKLTCTGKVPRDAEFWHVHLAARPQMNLRSVGRKRFAHLSENLDEIHVDANIPWGEDTLFTLEFRLDESGKYAIHTCNNKYLSLGGKLIDQCTKDCLFSAEYHSGQLALRDRAGSYLSPIGSKAVLKTRSNTVTRDELFSLEDSLPQASFVANLNSRFVSVKQGVDVTANQDEISDHETFQLEFDWTTKRWYIRTMQDRYWTLETGGGIQASGDKRSSNALFDLAWQQDGSVAFRANNGRYVITKRSGHLYATADSVDDNSKYYFYLINRPILVLKCEQGFVGYKSAASSKLECNKATYECIQVERGEKGVVYFKGQNSKYWHVDSEGVTSESDSQEGFYLELREPTRLCIKATGGSYLTASKNGLFRLGDSNYDSATQWEY